MGYILETTCPACGERHQYALGQSIRDCNYEEVLMHFSIADQAKIKDVMNKQQSKSKEPVLWYYENTLGYCAKCNKLLEIATLTFPNEGAPIKIAAHCECGAQATIIMDSEHMELQNQTYPCPCKAGSMNLSNIGKWD